MRPIRSIRLAHFILRQRAKRLLLAIAALGVISGLSMLSMMGRMSFVEHAYGWHGTASFCDSILWLFLGHPTMPVPRWMSVWCVVAASALLDARGAAGLDQGLVASGSRRVAWLAFVLVSVAIPLLAVFCVVLWCLMWAWLGGLAATLAPMAIGELSLGLLPADLSVGDALAFLALVGMGSALLGLAETVAGLWLGPLVSFGLSVATFSASALLPSAPLLGSLLMACRVFPAGVQLARGGLSFQLPLLVVLVLLLLCIAVAVCGCAAFSRSDLGVVGAKR